MDPCHEDKQGFEEWRKSQKETTMKKPTKRIQVLRDSLTAKAIQIESHMFQTMDIYKMSEEERVRYNEAMENIRDLKLMAKSLIEVEGFGLE